MAYTKSFSSRFAGANTNKQIPRAAFRGPRVFTEKQERKRRKKRARKRGAQIAAGLGRAA